MILGKIHMNRNLPKEIIHKSCTNGHDIDGRAQRKCPYCAGTQYDWGVGYRESLEPKLYTMHWFCAGMGGCQHSSRERMTNERLYRLRQRTHGAGVRKKVVEAAEAAEAKESAA